MFHDEYSPTLLADGPTPWGELRLVPTLRPDERRADWCVDGVPLASPRMTELRFGPWTGTVVRHQYQVEAESGAIARARDHSIEDAGRENNERVGCDWHRAQLLFGATNWAVVTSRASRAVVEGARKHHFEEFRPEA
ncbi:hypothetical protein [Jiangella endophytica]|uniref:hypothetical protein n=1 Tax=Jiangella endophytica TaxID=1623398 RepID=UPI000E3544B3|nr:hypothetical protein [Jiangella endophytica]